MRDTHGRARSLASTAAALLWMGALALPAAGAASRVEVVEYFDVVDGYTVVHFLTAFPAEQALLDAQGFLAVAPTQERRHPLGGYMRGWQHFGAWNAPAEGLVPVCRFLSRNSALPSHFYSAFDAECDALRAGTDWIYEGVAFYAALPDAGGRCAAGTAPVYRVMGVVDWAGASIHHYTTSRAMRRWLLQDVDSLVAGTGTFVSEGQGEMGVAFCVPASNDAAEARTAALAGGEWELTFAPQLAWYSQVTWAPWFWHVPMPLPDEVSLRMKFGAHIEADPSPEAFPMPWLWLSAPYRLAASISSPQFSLTPLESRAAGASWAGWDPFVDRITVVWTLPWPVVLRLEHTDATTMRGCLYSTFDSLFAWGPGAWVPAQCIPVTGRRL